MTFYLIDHPPKRRQYVTKRRALETGCIVVHTPEGGLDLHPPDTKAEQVAAYIASRTTPGSYHWISDSDSSVPMIPWTYEAAQDGTGSNPWAVGLSIACNADQWAHLLAYEPAWVDGALEQLAYGAAAYAADLYARTGIVIPARRISKAQSDAGHPGFISHAERDPGRRSDPGAAFPWARFLALFTSMTTPPGDDDVMAKMLVWAEGGDGTVWITDWETRSVVTGRGQMDKLLYFKRAVQNDATGLPFAFPQAELDQIPIDEPNINGTGGDGLTEAQTVAAVKRAAREGSGV